MLGFFLLVLATQNSHSLKMALTTLIFLDCLVQKLQHIVRDSSNPAKVIRQAFKYLYLITKVCLYTSHTVHYYMAK